jgi:hypothetical protein
MVDAETSVLVDTVEVSADVLSVVDTDVMGVSVDETVGVIAVLVSVELSVVVEVIGVNLMSSCADAGAAAARMPSASAEQSDVSLSPLTNPS